MKFKIFIDCNIIIDLLGKREPHYIFAAKLFSLVDDQIISGFTSPLVISNSFYILKKQIGNKQGYSQLKKIYDMLNIVKINKKITDNAFSNNYKDLEDDIHYFAALEANLDFLITRNKKNFKNNKIKILTAEEFIKIYTEFIKRAG